MARHAGAQIPLVLTITAPIKQVRLRLAVWNCLWMINPIGSRRLRECCCLTLEATEATELSPPNFRTLATPRATGGQSLTNLFVRSSHWIQRLRISNRLLASGVRTSQGASELSPWVI
jgi:hypothetical protein